MALTQRDNDVRGTVLNLVNIARGITAEANLGDSRIRIPSRDATLGVPLKVAVRAAFLGLDRKQRHVLVAQLAMIAAQAPVEQLQSIMGGLTGGPEHR